MRTNENGIAVPGEGCPLPWAVIPDHCGTFVADANGEEVFNVSRLENTAEFQVIAANYHERMAEIVRRFLEMCELWNTALASEVVDFLEKDHKLREDAAALWAEYQEAVK